MIKRPNETVKHIRRLDRVLDANASKAVSKARYSFYKNTLILSIIISISLIGISVFYHFIVKNPVIIEHVKIQMIDEKDE